MKTWLKVATYPVLAVFLLTAVPALCCCMDVAHADESTAHHAEARAVEHHHETGHHDHGTHSHHGAADKTSHHDHSQCEHPQLIGTLADTATVYFTSSDITFLKFSQDSRFVRSDVVVSDKTSDLPHDLGPPGHVRFFNTPLYLQVSVLLI